MTRKSVPLPIIALTVLLAIAIASTLSTGQPDSSASTLHTSPQPTPIPSQPPSTPSPFDPVCHLYLALIQNNATWWPQGE